MLTSASSRIRVKDVRASPARSAPPASELQLVCSQLRPCSIQLEIWSPLIPKGSVLSQAWMSSRAADTPSTRSWAPVAIWAPVSQKAPTRMTRKSTRVSAAPRLCLIPMRPSRVTTGWSRAVSSSAMVTAMMRDEIGASALVIVERAMPVTTTIAARAPTTQKPKGIA